MGTLLQREVNDNLTAVCLVHRDGGIFEVSVNKERLSDSYSKEFYYLGDAYDFFDWALENE